jgi:hypothetical protein
MMAKCKICNSKNALAINQALQRGEPVLQLHKQYGYSRSTISKHKKECIPALLDDSLNTKNNVIGTSGMALIEDVQSQINLVKKLVVACDEYLQDPDNPEKYFLGPRADEVEISYTEQVNGRASQVKKKALLQEIIDEIHATERYSILNITMKHADPRELLLKAIGKLEGTVKLINESSQKLIEWEHKKAALDKLSASGETEVSIERQIETITERVTVALKRSDAENLIKLAEMPDL